MPKAEFTDDERRHMDDAAAITAALQFLRKGSERLRTAPDYVLKSIAYACTTEPEVAERWNKRGDDAAGWQAALASIGALLERILDRLDAGAESDDETDLADSDPPWSARVAAMRKLGNIPNSVPAAMIVGGLLVSLDGRPGDDKILMDGEKLASDSDEQKRLAGQKQRDTVLRRAADRLAGALKEYKPPQMTTESILQALENDPAGLDSVDLSEMSDANFNTFRRKLHKMQQRHGISR